MWQAAAIAGGAQLLGGLHQQRESAKQAKLNRQFQERMARNAYQYAMQDMKKAGLNPMLAFSQGGAATPSGATASQDNIMSGVTNSALAAMNARQHLKNLESQGEMINAQTRQADATASHQQQLATNAYHIGREFNQAGNFWDTPEGYDIKKMELKGRAYGAMMGPIGQGVNSALGIAREIFPDRSKKYQSKSGSKFRPFRRK